jgi:hypothetical protein
VAYELRRARAGAGLTSEPRLWSRTALALAPTLLVLAALVPARSARAQEASASATPRPKFEAAVGMGASFDDAGMVAAGLSAVPGFFFMGGFGDGIVGIDIGVFVNSASGRFRDPNVPLDRVAFDGFLVIRPLADRWLSSARYAPRVARTLALDLGLGVEHTARLTRMPESVNRFGSRIGAHVDVPLTPRDAKSELRLRLAVRRFVGASRVTFPTGDLVTDSRGEVFAALAAVF